MKQHNFSAFLIVLVSVLLFSCNSGPSKRTAVGEALGTSYHITFYSEEQLPMDQALDSIFERVNQSMSTYREGSDISRVNRGDTMVRVDSLFQEVFRLSGRVYEESGGYFDPTVGNLVNFYGFGPEQGTPVVDSTKIDSLMQYVGFDKIRILESGKVTKTAPEVYLDFNAIAKGYTVDLIGHYLSSQGVSDYLVELGGELVASGINRSKNSPWLVGVDDPGQQEGERTITAAVELKDRAMATSGNYRKNRIDPETGKMYVHTVNPLTGYAIKSDVLSASVLAENCALADGYATAFMALGFERAKEMLEKLEEVDVLLIYAGDNGESKRFATPGFEEVLVEL